MRNDLSQTNHSKFIEVKTTVELPAPRFRGMRNGSVIYIALEDVTALLIETAEAFDNAHAVSDLGICFRALAKEIDESRVLDFA